MIEVFDNPEAVETLTLRGKIKEVANSANIAAVFMYDTRLDTDGGAWRKKCAGLSWYDETLNSATRGNRKEFPSRALIVADNTASSKTVKIYDADDPALPLWMSFDNETASDAFDSNAVNAIYAVNGRIYVAHATGVVIIDFPNDEIIERTTSGEALYLAGIVERNNAKGYGTATGTGIVNNVVNDVAAHVYAGANLDRLGLPIPTVYVATNNKCSVIHPSGDVYDFSDASGTRAHSSISVAPNGNVITYNGTNGSYQLFYHKNLFADYQTGADEKVFNSAVDTVPNYNAAGPATNTAAIGRDYFALRGGTENLTLMRPNWGKWDESAVAYITSKYNTGWMHGDIRGAWGLDKDHAATIVGSELITNGTFDTDTSGWTPSGSTLSVVSNTLRITNSGQANGRAISTAFSTTIGETYVVTVDGANLGTATNFRLEVRSGVESIDTWTSGSKTRTFVAVQSTTYVELYCIGADTTYCDYDNVTCRLAIPDRSVKGNGLGVYGTINVGAVATGADLRALSGFSASNYASQPNNSDFDFGTGDFHISFWMKLSDISATQYIISYGTTGSWSGAGIIAFANGSGQISFQISDDGFATSDNLNATPATDDDVWHKYDLFRRGSKFYLYTDSKEEDSTSVTNAAGSLTNSSAVLRVGNKPTDSTLALANGSLSIPHISATAPTPEQIKDMYEMERPLFFDNALCTLQADQVNDVSYDPVTDVLEVAEEATSGSSRIKGLEVVEVVKSDEDFGLAASKELDGITAVNGFRAAYTDGGAGINVPARDASSDLDIGLDGNGQKQIEFDAVTTDNTATVIGKIPIDENEFVAVDAMVRGAGYNDGSIYATYHIVGTFTRDIGGNVTLRGTVQDQHTAVESTGSYNAELVVDTTAQTVDVRVTGGASDRIQWHVDAQVNWKDDHHY